MKKRPRRHRQLVVAINGTKVVKGIFLFIATLVMVFIVTGALTSLKPELRPQASLYGVAEELPGAFFAQVIGMENQYFASAVPEDQKKMSFSGLSLKLATSINLEDPRSFLGRELPGFEHFDTKIIVAGEGTDYTNMPMESPPPSEVIEDEKEANLAELNKLEEDEQKEPSKEPDQTTGKRKVVYIYHTHNTESYLPFLKGESNPNNARHSKVNVTLVGEMFGKALDQQGVGNTVDKTEIEKRLLNKGLKYPHSYNESRLVVKEAMAKNDDLAYFIDIHRDSRRKKDTTVDIKGKKYARIAFVIGKKNQNYEKNLKLATEFHNLMEKKYKGLSVGVFAKGEIGDNGVYNQDLSDKALLLEFGGVDNNMNELKNAANAAADVFSEIFWDAEKVNGGSSSKKKQS
ncbi:stage II sporulation protein P [Bacillus sp. NPDC077027]|uniref:stage II sporulation protein P n=1 Tax=Bacillus sp. NPDC077027 TaxID=3390548 RepID=UPI003CFD5AD9